MVRRKVSVARKMLEEAVTAAEDALLSIEDKDSKEYRKLSNQVRYLKSEEASKDYYEKAKDLLRVLSRKWDGLTEYIENLNADVAQSHILFGPHGRPRHLWGHISPDKFAGYAMDRRGFNSMSQGYASDIGYVAMYLMDRVKWDLFDSRGYKTDMLLCNAVHDSAINDLHFRFAPLYMYLQEHCMVYLAREVLQETFWHSYAISLWFRFGNGH